MEKKEKGYEFRVISQVGSPSQNQWQEHARGKITALEHERPQTHQLNRLEHLFPLTESITDRENSQQEQPGNSLTRFGPRWNTGKHRQGSVKNHLFKKLELPDTFAHDLEAYKLHPALLDLAFAVPGKQGYYAPFLYRKVVIFSNTPQDSYVLLTSAKENANHPSGGQALTYDITLMDKEGVERLRVNEYTLLEISAQQVEISLTNAQVSTGASRDWPEDVLVTNFLQDGLLPAEGVEVFRRVLGGTVPQVLVSTQPLAERLQALLTLPNLETPGIFEQLKKNRITHPRPDLSTPYLAPQTQREKQLAEIWQHLLGIDRVGIHDNFFDLGATSLTLMNINHLVKESLGEEIPVVKMYIYPTLAELGRYLDQEEGVDVLSPPAGDNSKRGKLKNKLKQRKRNIKGASNG